MPRIFFVNRVYAPATEATAQLLGDLATGLAAAGEAVTVLTGTPSASGGSDGAEGQQDGGVEVHRLTADRERRFGMVAKAVHYARFIIAVRRRLRALVRPGDVVVAMTDPPLLGPAIGGVVRSVGGRMWHWSQDVYPEVAVALRPAGPFSPLLGLFRPWRDREWRAAEGIVTIGTDMAALVGSRGIPTAAIKVQPNWAPAGLDFSATAIHRDRWGVGREEIVVAYSGNLGRAHTLRPLLELAALCRNETNLRFLIVGNGPQRSALVAEAKARGLSNLTFLPPVPRAELGSSLAAADVHIITMRPECAGTVWPSKFYGVVAAGRPILFLGPAAAEVFQIVRRESLGAAVEEADMDAALAFLLGLRRDPAVRAALTDRVRAFGQTLPGPDAAVAGWRAILHRRQGPVSTSA